MAGIAASAVADAVIFVDDAVLGRLPPRCVCDGVHTADRGTFRAAAGADARLGLSLLLVLAGPIGWLVLVLQRQRERLTVRLPYSEPADQRLRRARRTSAVTGWALFACVVMAAVCFGHGGVGGWCFGAIAAVVGGAVGARWIAARRVHRSGALRIELDASRRWVTVHHVHPAFAQAVDRARDGDRSLPD